MKQVISSFLLVTVAILTVACKVKNYPATAEVRFVDNPSAGLATLEATGYGKSEQEAELYAYTTAFSNIFFKGIAGFTPLQRPMITDEAKAKSTHAQYFRKFFTERGYMQFITQQSSATQLGKADDRKNRVAKRLFTLNYEALRRDLEQNGVIRKFGF